VSSLNEIIDESLESERQEDGEEEQDRSAEERQSLRVQKLEAKLEVTESTLRFIRRSLDDMTEHMQEQSVAAKNEAINNFFTSMNAQKYGRLLDSALEMSAKLRDLRREQFKMPVELMGMSILVRICFRSSRTAASRRSRRRGRSLRRRRTSRRTRAIRASRSRARSENPCRSSVPAGGARASLSRVLWCARQRAIWERSERDGAEFFLGIDLGTTNSVISYINTRDGKLIPTVLEVPRISDTQGTTSAKTLPSTARTVGKRSSIPCLTLRIPILSIAC